MPENLLIYGDNLDVLRRHVADESIDLVYLDPPFNSNAAYNVLFAERDGAGRVANQGVRGHVGMGRGGARPLRKFVETGPDGASRAMQAFRAFSATRHARLSGDDAPRLVSSSRLKPTGSLYLHCDPTASHYLKMLMDAIFGPGQLPQRDHLEAEGRERPETNSAAITEFRRDVRLEVFLCLFV